MEIRDIRRDDVDGIPGIARASLAGSYGGFLGEETIDEMVEQWYDRDRIAAQIDDENDVFVVADRDGPVGFGQGSVLDGDHVVGEIHWLHVTPDERGTGVGVQLLGHLQEELEKLGAEVIRGNVLAENEEGRRFYEDHGFDERTSRTVTVAREEHEEVVYEKPVTDRSVTQVVESIAGPDGTTSYVNFSEPERGSKAPFYPTFSDEGLSERFGWMCGNCESIETAMDSMGRIVCNTCGNHRKATRWDAAYL